jgi:hypothetical protein
VTGTIHSGDKSHRRAGKATAFSLTQFRSCCRNN